MDVGMGFTAGGWRLRSERAREMEREGGRDSGGRDWGDGEEREREGRGRAD